MNINQFYIGGHWVNSRSTATTELINPATEQITATIALGGALDVDLAVSAAKRAFPVFSRSSREERLTLLKRIRELYTLRFDDLAKAMTLEMGVPIAFSRSAQTTAGLEHIDETIATLKSFVFEKEHKWSLIVSEPIGVCGLITPWNWPINQIAVKVLPALASGCTMVLKPSEFSPLSANVFAEILHDAGVPSGVFNLVHGDGAGAGAALSTHLDVDMVSFTGSTRAGIAIAQAAAPSVKRVTQELGGKAANILLDDVDFEALVKAGALRCFMNSGQSCAAPTRMLVPRSSVSLVHDIASRVAAGVTVGSPDNDESLLGPVVNRAQYERIQEYIALGIEQGATLIAGGLGRPTGVNRGYFVRPTVFGNVTPDMRIAREEIFGPVLAIIPYDDDDHAVAIANDSDFGLSGFVSSASIDRARKIAREIRAGQIHINHPQVDRSTPFGGYRKSGNGREWAEHGMREYLELKTILGYNQIT